LTETNEYDAIFTALKHPIRRQILLLLEQKGEASFTDIQNALGIDDTGLTSYHLKELAPLVEQTARGRYRLSEVGQTSLALFRKVEQKKQITGTAVRKELEKLIEEVVYLFFIVAITLIAPLTVDIYVSVQNISGAAFSLAQTVGLYLIGLAGLLLGALLFVFYDRRYFSETIRKNVVHSALFAIATSLLLVPSAYLTHRFEEAILSLSSFSSYGSVAWLLMIMHAASLIAAAPLVAYVVGKLAKSTK